MRKRFSIKITGMVQGVFFRASTKEKAQKLDIKGFVRNENDGSVYIEAEGETENLMSFIQWCAEGPESARVDRCDVSEVPQIGSQNFTIQR